MNVYAVRYVDYDKLCVVTQFVKADDSETAGKLVPKEIDGVWQVYHDDGRPLLSTECTIG